MSVSREDYLQQCDKDRKEWQEAEARYKAALDWAYTQDIATQRKLIRHYAKTDLYFLCIRVLRMKFFYDVERPEWLYKRCQEVQADPDGYLDVWAREHFKSTIITFAKTIQDILNDPEITIGIFSFNRPVAKKFLKQIKQELETNELLKWCFPDVLWQNPRIDAPKAGLRWSLDGGIIVKRKSNQKEATVEAWGLVDGQPTGAHFKLRIYDDVITIDSVTSPEMIQKVTAAWEMSINLGRDGGAARYIGTFYHYADTYRTMIERGAVKVRKYPCFHNGREDGVNVLQSQDYLKEKRLNMGAATFAAQMLCEPKMESSMGFKLEWLKYWDADQWNNMNIYIFVDPASKKKKTSDYTTMWVIGLGSDQNFYVLDMVRDRLGLTERAAALFRLHRKYRPMRVYYEEYGLQADVEHIEYEQKIQNYRFQIDKVGGRLKKEDRIENLSAVLERGRLYMRTSCFYVDYQKQTRDLVQVFIAEEYILFPFSKHDDMLDSLARITDEAVELMWPEEKQFGDTFFRHHYDHAEEETDLLHYGLS